MAGPGHLQQAMHVEANSPGGASTAFGGGTSEATSLLDMSPQKRGRTEQQGLTLEAIRDMVRGELQSAVGQVNERVGTFEQNVTGQFAETFQRLARVENETEASKERLATVEDKVEGITGRITRLEQSGPPAMAGNSSTDTRPPALIIGGWHPDTEADKVIDHANKLVAELRLDLDMRDAFVPGIRRGYAIVPLIRKDNESSEDQRARVQHCIRQVRNANVTISTKLSGEPSRLFLNISQPPEKRRKVQVAAKCKRLLMELGALPTEVETEYSTGQVWFKSRKVASASNNMAPAGSTTTGTEGWIDLRTIADKLHRSLESVQNAWQPLGAVLK